jgi:hypothetical protein
MQSGNRFRFEVSHPTFGHGEADSGLVSVRVDVLVDRSRLSCPAASPNLPAVISWRIKTLTGRRDSKSPESARTRRRPLPPIHRPSRSDAISVSEAVSPDVGATKGNTFHKAPRKDACGELSNCPAGRQHAHRI